MRKIDSFAREHFDGDIQKALLHLLDNSNEDKMDDYVDELTREESNFVYLAMRDLAITHYGGLENYRKELKKQQVLAELGMEEAEVAEASVNPFRKDLFKKGLAFLAIVAVSGLLLAFGPALSVSQSTVSIGAALFLGLFSMSAAETVTKFFKFRKAKKLV